MAVGGGGTFEVYHNLLGESRILATMAHKSDILGLHLCLVAGLASCSMRQGGRTGEHLEMLAAKEGNYTPVEHEIDSWVALIECLCSLYFQLYFLLLPHCSLALLQPKQPSCWSHNGCLQWRSVR